MNVAEFILNNIKKFGVDAAFCLTGGMAMHINRAASESDLRVVYCNHEQAVAAAADGYAKAKEYCIPGLAIVTSGPGVTNTITSVASAFYDSVPLFILAGQVKVADINTFGVRTRGAQETPQLALMSPITKKAFRYNPSEINDETLAQYLALAMTGRKGPVFIEIPLDIQPQIVVDAEARIEKIHAMILQHIKNDEKNNVDTAALIVNTIKSSHRPVLMIGNGLRIAGVSRQKIKMLVEKFNVPTLFTWPSFDLLESDHPLNFGCPGGLAATHSNKILQSADSVIFFGVRLDLLTTAFNAANYGKNAKRIVIDIDENEIAKNNAIPNTTFIQENVVGIVNALLATNELMPKHFQDWTKLANQLRLEDSQQEKKAFSEDKLTTYNIARILAKQTRFHYIVPTGSGYAIEGIARFFKPQRNMTFSYSGHSLGSMGLGLPTAIGASTALQKPVICLEGDGGLLLNIQEIFTMAANPDLPIIIIILNNAGYQSIVKSQVRAFGKEFGASSASGLYDYRYDLLANAAQLPYQKCESVDAFELALQKCPMRCVLEVMTAEDGYRGPAVQTKFDSNGKPYSTDIGDISWGR